MTRETRSDGDTYSDVVSDSRGRREGRFAGESRAYEDEWTKRSRHVPLVVAYDRELIDAWCRVSSSRLRRELVFRNSSNGPGGYSARRVTKDNNKGPVVFAAGEKIVNRQQIRSTGEAVSQESDAT